MVFSNLVEAVVWVNRNVIGALVWFFKNVQGVFFLAPPKMVRVWNLIASSIKTIFIAHVFCF